MKKKEWLVSRVLCLVFIWAALLLCTTGAHAKDKPIKLKAAAMAPKPMPIMMCFDNWCKEIEKRTDGRVKFDIYWSASLLKAQDAFKGTGQGLADVCIDVPAYHPSLTPLMTVGELGFITSKVDAPARALLQLYKEFPAFREESERHNVKIMSFVPMAPNIMGTTGPVHKLEDLKGKKIRALGILNRVVADLGGTPVAIPVPDLYESMNRKVIQGFTGFPLSAVQGFKLNEVAKYYLDYGYGNYLVQVVAFNKNKWNSLPADIQKTIEQVNADAMQIYVKTYANEEHRFVEPLKKAGCKFYTLPTDEAERWKNLVVPAMWNEWVKEHEKDGPARKFFDRYVELVKKYEKDSSYVNPFPK